MMKVQTNLQNYYNYDYNFWLFANLFNRDQKRSAAIGIDAIISLLSGSESKINFSHFSYSNLMSYTRIIKHKDMKHLLIDL